VKIQRNMSFHLICVFGGILLGFFATAVLMLVALSDKALMSPLKRPAIIKNFLNSCFVHL